MDTSVHASRSRLFQMMVVVSFLSLVLYRLSVRAPVWFDELFMKALLFGAPFWIYAVMTKKRPENFGFGVRQFWSGAFAGLAIGGIFSFLGMILFSFQKGTILIPGLFGAAEFWREFGLAFATAWWESLFFYGFILSHLKERLRGEWEMILAVTLLFLLFHAPILMLKAGIVGAIQPLVLLGFFAFGQAIVYLRTQSIASVVVSHAFWGMALLVYGR